MSSNDVSVVLVHGAWADGSSWAKVIAPLAADGFKVVAAPLPLTSFRDDVAALDRTLERVTGPIVLVGHAYAGAVIGATRNEKVKGARLRGRTGSGRGRNGRGCLLPAEPHPQAPKLAPDNHGLIYLPEGGLRRRFRAACLPRKSWPCWRRFSGRSRRHASPSPSTGRCGRTVRPGSSWPSRTA